VKKDLLGGIPQTTKIGIALILALFNFLFRELLPRLEAWWVLLGGERALLLGDKTTPGTEGTLFRDMRIGMCPFLRTKHPLFPGMKYA